MGAEMQNTNHLIGRQLAEQVDQLDFNRAIGQFEELGLSQEDVLAAQVKAYNWRSGKF